MDFLIPKVYAAGLETATSENKDAFGVLLNKIFDNIVSPVIYLIIALAVVYFVWGVLVFIQNADNADKRKEGYDHMIWGIIGLFIILSAQGIISIIRNTLGG